MAVSPNTIKIKRGKFSHVIYSGSDPYELKFFTDIKRLGVGSNVVAGDYKVDTFVETLNAGEGTCSITVQLTPTISHITVVTHDPNLDLYPRRSIMSLPSPERNEQNFTFLPPREYSQGYTWYTYTKPTMGSCTITYNRVGQAEDHPEVVTFLVERG